MRKCVSGVSASGGGGGGEDRGSVRGKRRTGWLLGLSDV